MTGGCEVFCLAAVPFLRIEDDTKDGLTTSTWDSATGQMIEEELPAEVQELMGVKKKVKVASPDANAWVHEPVRTIVVSWKSESALLNFDSTRPASRLNTEPHGNFSTFQASL